MYCIMLFFKVCDILNGYSGWKEYFRVFFYFILFLNLYVFFYFLIKYVILILLI